MKKLSVFLLVVLAAAVLVSCASTKSAEEEPVAEVVEDSRVTVTSDGIPVWVYSDISTPETHYVIGYGKMSNKQNSIKRAQAEAKNVMAEWVSTSIDEITMMYSNDAGTEGNRQAVDAFETISKQRAQATISGAKQEALWEDTDGGVWVLMSIPVSALENSIYTAFLDEEVQQKFERNEAAEEANRMMNEAITKYFGRK